MLTVSSLLGVRSTLHMPSSSFSRMAASWKRAAAASHVFFSFSSDMETCGVNVATVNPPSTLYYAARRGQAFSLPPVFQPALFGLSQHYPPSNSSAFRTTGSRCNSTWSPRSTPNAWLKISVLRSEEHTSELQSLRHLVCRLLLDK